MDNFGASNNSSMDQPPPLYMNPLDSTNTNTIETASENLT